ncbi:hypothetical protein CSUI_008209, partial [Cystoisospora suis]
NDVSRPVCIVPFYGPGAYSRRFTAAYGYSEGQVSRVLVLNTSLKPCRILGGAIVARIVECAREAVDGNTSAQGRRRVNAARAVGENWEAEIPSLRATQACRTPEEFG